MPIRRRLFGCGGGLFAGCCHGSAGADHGVPAPALGEGLPGASQDCGMGEKCDSACAFQSPGETGGAGGNWEGGDTSPGAFQVGKKSCGADGGT
jgi:hypothetical protein